MDTILYSYFLQTNLKSRLFQNVKKVPTSGIPEICWAPIFGIPIVVTIFTQMPISGIPFIQYIISVFLFVEFQKQALFSKFSICVFPGVLPIFEMDRFLEFQQQGLFGQYPDFWNSIYMVIPHTHLLNPLFKSVLIQNAMNNLTFYPLCKEIVGYLFHFFHSTFEETLEVRDPLMFLIKQSFLENMEFTENENNQYHSPG